MLPFQLPPLSTGIVMVVEELSGCFLSGQWRSASLGETALHQVHLNKDAPVPESL